MHYLWYKKYITFGLIPIIVFVAVTEVVIMIIPIVVVLFFFIAATHSWNRYALATITSCRGATRAVCILTWAFPLVLHKVARNHWSQVWWERYTNARGRWFLWCTGAHCSWCHIDSAVSSLHVSHGGTVETCTLFFLFDLADDLGDCRNGYLDEDVELQYHLVTVCAVNRVATVKCISWEENVLEWCPRLRKRVEPHVFP